MQAERTSGYPLREPRKDEFLSRLARFTSEREAQLAWRSACQATGVDPGADKLERGALLRVLERMSQAEGVTSVLARSFSIRLLSHALLEKQAVDAPSGDEQVAASLRADERLAALGRLDLGVVVHDEELGQLVRQAAERFKLPIAAINVVLDNTLFFLVPHGIGGWMAQAGGVPAEWAPCTEVVDRNATFAIRDAQADAAARENPLVRIDGVRCYLGVPLRDRSGQVLGTMCVIGTEARDFSEEEARYLRELGEQVGRRLLAIAERRN
jgi:GAF domain-containing protein